MTDGNGIPLAGVLTGANVHDVTKALEVIDRIRVTKPEGGRPRCRPEEVAADKGYDSRMLRRELRARGIQPVIPTRVWKNRKKRPGRQPGSFVKDRVNNRWKIERTFAWQDHSRRLTVRWERDHRVFEGFLMLWSAMMCLKRILR